MPRVNNPVLGYVTCGCDKRATVHQVSTGSGRRKGYLYTRCDCGCDQRTGAKIQRDWWGRTEWLDGEPELRPPNLGEPEEWTPEEAAPAPAAPATEPTPQPTEPAPQPGRLGLLAVGLAGMVAALVTIGGTSR